MARRGEHCGDLVVPDSLVVGRSFVGDWPALVPVPQSLLRRLDARAIRRELPRAPRPDEDTLVDVIFDESGSVTGGNDVVGLRHELILIACEHLAGTGMGSRWYLRVQSFDSPSAFDLPVTRLDRRGLNTAREVLLRASAGGSSCLGPALHRAESDLGDFKGRPRLLVVLTDFELFDPVPAVTLAAVVCSSAREVLAVSLNNAPPITLRASRVRTAQVTAGDQPAVLARHVTEAAASACMTSGKRGS